MYLEEPMMITKWLSQILWKNIISPFFKKKDLKTISRQKKEEINFILYGCHYLILWWISWQNVACLESLLVLKIA